MVNLHDIRYVRVGTTDLDSAIRFATDIVGLQLVAREGKAAYFRSDKVAVRGDTRDHTHGLFRGRSRPTRRSASTCTIPPTLDAVGAELENAGHRVHVGTREECDQRRVKAFIASHDPSGNRIEFVAKPYHSGTRYFPGRDAGVTRVQPYRPLHHRRAARRKVLDAAVQCARVRLDRRRGAAAHQHRAPFAGAVPGAAPRHPAHQPPGRGRRRRHASWYFLRDKGVKILLGPGRHPLSTAVMLYFRGPDGMIFEYSCGVKHIMPEEEATYRPRQFPFERYAVCMWGSVPDPEISAFPQGEAAAKATPLRGGDVLRIAPRCEAVQRSCQAVGVSISGHGSAWTEAAVLPRPQRYALPPRPLSLSAPACTRCCSASPRNCRRRPATSPPRRASARLCSSLCSVRSAPSAGCSTPPWSIALRYRLGLYGAGLVSYLVAATGTWLCNRLWTFRGSGGGPAHRQWARFLTANAVGFVLNRGTYALLVTFVALCAAQPVLPPRPGRSPACL